MTPETILSRTANVAYEVVAGETMLVDLNTGIYFSLNEVGTLFWERLDGQQTIAEHAAALAARYDVAVQRVTQDLVRLADKLVTEKLALAVQ